MTCASDWNHLRFSNQGVSRDQRHIVHDTGCTNDFIGRVALEIELCRSAGDFKCDRPHSYSIQCMNKNTVVEINIDTA